VFAFEKLLCFVQAGAATAAVLFICLDKQPGICPGYLPPAQKYTIITRKLDI
jgi:hypothetical protein